MIDAGTTRVGRARVHGAVDPTIARQRLGSLLAGAELRPPGLPPSAVLCVRQIVDPLPGVLRLDTAGVRAPPEWERAFVAALERALRNAARPAREAVPAGAEAVLFADRAELLACLARDARDGTAWTQWWWRDLRASAGSGGDPVVTAWLETPEHVPAALELLATRGEAVRFVAGLTPAAAAAIVERVATAFALQQLHPHATPTAAETAAVRGAGTARAAPPPDPPWRTRVPEATRQALVPTAELLLGVALMLRRAPVEARTPAFAQAARVWLVAARDFHPAVTPVDVTAATPAAARNGVRPQRPHPPRPLQPTEANVDAGAAVEPLAPTRLPETPPAHADEPESVPAPSGRAVAKPSSTAPAADAPPPGEPAADIERSDARPAPAPGSSRPASKSARGEVETDTPPPRRRKRAPARPKAAAALTPPPAPAPEPSADLPALVVATRLGGVFYLLGFALYLDLYGDFTRPLEPGLPLSPWDFLALLGPTLLEDPSRDDPLWRLLARLAGRRRRERPGAAFSPPDAWRTPKAWLEPFDHDGTWRWSAAGGTLRLVHPVGFPVVAVPRTDEPPEKQLARELRRLRPLGPTVQRASLPRESTRPLVRWTARLAAYSHARLGRALDLRAGDALDDMLFRRRARVFVTPTHVDVVLRLADLPLAVRFAGLDRTPGWIPAAGRYVALHFE